MKIKYISKQNTSILWRKYIVLSDFFVFNYTFKQICLYFYLFYTIYKDNTCFGVTLLFQIIHLNKFAYKSVILLALFKHKRIFIIFAILLVSLKMKSIFYNTMKVQYIYTSNFYSNQNNFNRNQKFIIKTIIRNLYSLAQ